VTPAFDDARIKIVDFQYTTEEMRCLATAAFNQGNCVDDGGRYDWRGGGSSITVWVDTASQAGDPNHAIKAIFYGHPGAHDPWNPHYIDTMIEAIEGVEFNDNKFCAVYYADPYTYEDALIELGILEQRALGRIVYGQA
jgi:hypothetical protein